MLFTYYAFSLSGFVSTFLFEAVQQLALAKIQVF